MVIYIICFSITEVLPTLEIMKECFCPTALMEMLLALEPPPMSKWKESLYLALTN